MNPKISLIVSVYNMQQYLKQFLDSVIQQSFNSFEAIFVDDGSTDNSPSILDEFAKKDSRYIVIHQENKGVCAARNTAISCAKGEYIYIVDSDDWLADDALISLWKTAEKYDADVIYGSTYSETSTGSTKKLPFPHPFFSTDRKTINEIQCALNNNNLIYVQCPDFKAISYLGGAPWRGMFKKSIIDKYNLRYNEQLRSLGEDILFWQNIYEHVKSVAYTNSPIYHYRQVDSSLSHGYKSDLLSIYQKSFREQEKFLTENNKGNEHREAYYFRVILYIKQSLAFYYLNKKNKKSNKDKYKEFKAMLHSKPYNQAIAGVRSKKLVSKKNRALLLLLKLRMYKLYWLLFKIKNSSN